MKVKINPGLAEVMRLWTASEIEKRQPRLCCEVPITGVREAVDMAVEVVESWATGVLLARDSSGTLMLLDDAELAGILGEEFLCDGTLSVSKLDTIGGCSFDFSIAEGDSSGDGEFMAAGWGDVEESVRAVSQRDPTAVIFRGN